MLRRGSSASSWLYSLSTVLLLLVLVRPSSQMNIPDNALSANSAPHSNRQVNRSPKGVCNYNDRLNCAKDWTTETLDLESLATCEACGNIWSNIVGMAWCCRCNPKVFSFCWEKVHQQALL